MCGLIGTWCRTKFVYNVSLVVVLGWSGRLLYRTTIMPSELIDRLLSDTRPDCVC